MLFVYVDDFGHSGPYVARTDPKHNTSPIYGFAGFALPASELRAFSSFFLQLKQNNLSDDIKRAQKPVYRWEKKGTNLFTKNSIQRYRAVREMGFRLLGEIQKRNGFVFYHGREKIRTAEAQNPIGLQTTVLSHSIRRLNRAAGRARMPFSLIMDQCSAKLDLLECAQKTMYGTDPCRNMVSPPFEVESHLDQCMQAADWVATLVGRVWAWRLDPEGFSEYADYDRYYGDRLQRAASFSSVEKRSDIPRNYVLRPTKPSAVIVAQERTITTITETQTVVAVPPAADAAELLSRRFRVRRSSTKTDK